MCDVDADLANALDRADVALYEAKQAGRNRIRIAGNAPRRSGVSREMITTISLKAVSVGTELQIVQAGIPDAIPVEQCYLGWQESLLLLGKLVEAEVPD